MSRERHMPTVSDTAAHAAIGAAARELHLVGAENLVHAV